MGIEPPSWNGTRMVLNLSGSRYQTWIVDVKFRGRSRLIACAVLETDRGLTLIDPGPSTTLHTLEDRLQPWGGIHAVQNIVLTHIHLDHAGGAGQLAASLPDAKIYVHPIGVHHLVNPERLIQSARRIYGDRMDQLWGEILSIPERQVYAVEDGALVDVGGRRLRACYTPGHASHHIAWLEDAAKLAFVGDAAGMRIQGSDYIIPVAPPPDIDLILWEASLQRLQKEEMSKLFLTHFGVVENVDKHLSEMSRRLHFWAHAVQQSLNDNSESDALRAKAFHASEMRQMRSLVISEFQEPYNYMGQPSESWYGLARYWRKRGAVRQ
ncbi:MAG: MBL fold metallo-hydrolase [Bacteroidetes bacterium]|nr:MBL fold metallo-hydrolase [Bacteroidota bacterium]MCY4204598.1 MBL fold metallo-hydrolase [Bacteroidota bacterium]